MNWYAARSYVSYFLKARHKKAHGIHSPFLYHLITEVFNGDEHLPAFDQIESYRKRQQQNKIPLEQTIGAGSKYRHRHTIASVATTGITRPHYARLLFRLAKYFNARTVLELGTSLGISTMYLAAVPQTKIITVEGNVQIANEAQQAFEQYGYTNITLEKTLFDDYLKALPSDIFFDMVFVDGNHRKEATVSYFEQLLKHAHNDTVFVFDDIHWSPGMTEAWKHIVNNSSATLTIDIFQFGLVFLKKELSKQHFVIRYSLF